MATIERTAYPRLRGGIGAQELDEFFTPTLDEMTWAQSNVRSGFSVLTLLVLLKAFQRLGYFPEIGVVPAPIVHHVRAAVGLGELVEPADSERTMKRQRAFVRDRLGIRHDPAEVLALAERVIRSAVQTKDNPADLINVALEELIRARCELPAM